MTGPVRDRVGMIAGMSPVLLPGRYYFCLAPGDGAVLLSARALGTFREDEGFSLILPEDAAAEAGLADGPAMRCIRLDVHSSLEGVGLTAAVSGVLAEAGIACNMVAAFHHDHAFVPEADAERALALLQALQASERKGGA